MAFSYTNPKFLSRASVRRTWLAIGTHNRYLRLAAGPGLIVAYAACAFVDGTFPPDNEFLTPMAFNLLPVIFVFGIILYFIAWTADEHPVKSRRVLLMAALIFAIGYAGLVGLYQPESVLNRAGFWLYIVVVGALALAQLRATNLSADSKTDGT